MADLSRLFRQGIVWMDPFLEVKTDETYQLVKSKRKWTRIVNLDLKHRRQCSHSTETVPSGYCIPKTKLAECLKHPFISYSQAYIQATVTLDGKLWSDKWATTLRLNAEQHIQTQQIWMKTLKKLSWRPQFFWQPQYDDKSTPVETSADHTAAV